MDYVETEFFKGNLNLNRLSLRLVRYLLAAWSLGRQGYMYNQSVLCTGFLYDMFGYVEANTKMFDLPRYVDEDFIALCRRRARELGPSIIAWSGGIDSTFLLACFVAENIPVTTATAWRWSRTGMSDKFMRVDKKLSRFVLKEFGNINIDHPRKIYREDVLGNYHLMTDSILPGKMLIDASWADALFFPNQRMQQDIEWHFENDIRKVNYYYHKYIPLEDVMFKCKVDGNRVFSDFEIDKIKEYSVVFGKPINTNNRIARFLNYCFVLPLYLSDNNLFVLPNKKSFFCTQDFLNLAYSKFWDVNDLCVYPRDKKIELDFIREVFKQDFKVKCNW